MRPAFLAACISIVAIGCAREPSPPSKTAEPMPAPATERQARPDDRPVIVAFGNSLTAGLGVDIHQNYPAVLQSLLDARGLRYRVMNAGVSGDTTGGGVARLQTVLAYKPAAVILELGANDGLRGLPVETTRANLEQIITALENAGARVVLAGMTLPPNYGPEYIRSFEQVFVELAQKYKIPRIPFLLEDVATRRERMQGDGLHPNAAGYKVVAATVMLALEPLLR